MHPTLTRLARAAAPAVCAAALAAAAHAADPTPCSDFDAYVNGRWEASTPLPANRARIGSFITLRDGNDVLLTRALAELATQPVLQTSPGLRLLARHYSAGMDSAAIEARGLQPLAPLLRRIDQLTRADLPALLGEMARLGLNPPLGLFVGPDAREATRHVLNLVQGGLGLPDRDDYSRSDANARRVQAAYRTHAATLLRAAGVSAAGSDAAAIDALMAFEAQLAAATLTRAQRRDPVAGYNVFDRLSLTTLGEGLGSAALLRAYGLDERAAPKIIVGQTGHARAVAQAMAEAALPVWQNYLRVRVLDAVAEHGPQALWASQFAYRGMAVKGLKEAPLRAEQVILMTGGAYGGAPLAQALGELYVQRAFGSEAQARSLQMLADIKTAMHQRIDALAWMSPATKVLAQAKLDAMSAKIGAPERWPTFDGLALEADDFMGNLLASNGWQTAQRLADLDAPVDRTRWNTSPHIVNAFAASGNQIVFPAGILQPPFFDARADDASNFGGIGMVIGHEITHHFDDRGRQFDAAGNLRDWWQPADAAAYKARADRVAALYGSFEPVPGVPIDGQLTLGENLSDVGGIQIAFAGLQIALARQGAAGRPVALIDGQTPEQRFFITNALVWRSKSRTEALVDQLRTDSHSPGRWRVLGPMSQMPAFALAFDCKPGDAMVAGDPITVW